MIISFGYLSKKMLIPLLIPLVYLLRHFVLEQANNEKENNEISSIFINTFIASLSYSINILLLGIENELIKSIRKSKQNKEFDNQLLIEKIKIEKKKTKKRILFLIIISIYNFFNLQAYDLIKILMPDNYKQYYFYSISITVFFLSTALFSYLLLGIKIYKHQILSMIISPILSILMFIVFITDLVNESITKTFLYLIICLLVRNFRFILMVFGKLIMEKYYVTQTKLLSYFGICGLILSLITNCFSYFIEFPDYENEKYFYGKRLLNIFDYWKYMKKGYFIFSIFLWFIENYLIWFCISGFSPNHYIIFRNISSILVILPDIYKEEQFGEFDIWIKIFSSFGLFGIYICGLIFNEIIIIRIWNLEKYTAIELDKRQREETENIINADNNDDETRNVFSEISDSSNIRN